MYALFLIHYILLNLGRKVQNIHILLYDYWYITYSRIFFHIRNCSYNVSKSFIFLFILLNVFLLNTLKVSKHFLINQINLFLCVFNIFLCGMALESIFSRNGFRFSFILNYIFWETMKKTVFSFRGYFHIPLFALFTE